MFVRKLCKQLTQSDNNIDVVNHQCLNYDIRHY